jgi:F-type H+-transporting ATPase subunit delta
MKSSKQSRRESKALFQACLVDGRMDDDRVRETVRRVIEAKPRGAKLLLDHFTRLVRIAVARRTARVETAFPLETATARSIESQLRERYGDGLDISFVTEPALIGGMRVRVGSDVLDGSVRGRLAALDERW